MCLTPLGEDLEWPEQRPTLAKRLERPAPRDAALSLVRNDPAWRHFLRFCDFLQAAELKHLPQFVSLVSAWSLLSLSNVAGRPKREQARRTPSASRLTTLHNSPHPSSTSMFLYDPTSNRVRLKNL